MSISDIYKATTYAATGAFAFSLINSFRKTDNPSESVKIKQIRKLEKAIFFVATGQYVLNLGIKDFKTAQRLRYLDWIITTPMLLKSLHLLAEEKGFKGSYTPALIFNILMIVAGYIAEFTPSKRNRLIFLALGFLAFAGVLVYVNQWGSYLRDQGVKIDDLLKFFYIGWTVYGLNFMTPNEEVRQSIFNVSDLFNKGAYSLVLEELLTNGL